MKITRAELRKMILEEKAVLEQEEMNVPEEQTSLEEVSADVKSANELAKFIKTDHDMRHEMDAVFRFLMKKKTEGQYKERNAFLLIKQIVDKAAKEFQELYGEQGVPWEQMFPDSVREQIAQQKEKSFSNLEKKPLYRG